MTGRRKMVDAWEGWEGERRLWVTLGTTSVPVALAVLALQPDVVVPIISPQSREVLASLKDVLRNVADERAVVWEPPVIVPPDDPAEIARVLQRGSHLPGHLAFSGGTAAMSAVVYHHWKQHCDRVAGSRAWYLADRAGELRSDDVVLDLSSTPAMGSSLPGLLRLRGLDRRVRSRYEIDLAPEDTLQATDVSWPFSDDSNQGLVSLIADLLRALLDGGLDRATGSITQWDELAPHLAFPRSPGLRAGWILELAAFALAARFLLQMPNRLLPIEVRVGTEVGPSGGNPDLEIDVGITSGPRLTVISCGIDERRSALSTKYFEARDRAKQLGGSESRSLTLVSRSGPQRPHDRAGAIRQMAAHRKAIDWGVNPERDRHYLATPLEAFADLDATSIRDVLLDPQAELSAGDEHQQALARFLRSSIYR